MVYRPDEQLFKLENSHEVKAVGWLEREKSYKTTSELDAMLIDALISNFDKWDGVTHRGFHICNLCDNTKTELTKVFWKEKLYMVGNRQWYFLQKNSDSWSAPNMLLHYMVAHLYRPPAKFREAVLLDEFKIIKTAKFWF